MVRKRALCASGYQRGVVARSSDFDLPLSSRVLLSVAEPRFSTAVMATVAVLAVLLAPIGLYGALSYSVSRRRREIGVRAALGADRGRLVSLVLRQGLGLTMVGLAAGLAAAAFLTKLLSTLLFGIGPLDSLSFASAAALVTCAYITAAFRAQALADKPRHFRPRLGEHAIRSPRWPALIPRKPSVRSSRRPTR